MGQDAWIQDLRSQIY